MAFGAVFNQNPILRDANGYAIFTESGTFNPADYNLTVGTLLNVVCVGGGQGGLDGTYSPNTKTSGGAAGFGGRSRIDCGGGGGSGGGFGAGGGGGGSADNYQTGDGGDAGEVIITSVKLTSTDSITVTIGAGGSSNGGNGGNTTFGSYITARGGGSFTNNIAPGGVSSGGSSPGGGGGGGGYILSNGLFGGSGGVGNGLSDQAVGAPAFIGGAGGSPISVSSIQTGFNPASSIYGGYGGLGGQHGGSAGIGSGLCIVAW